MLKNRKSTQTILYGLSILTLVVLLRLFVFDMYKISGFSMEPTLVPGDYILVNKLSFNLRLINVWKLISKQGYEYSFCKEIGKINNGDVLVFKQPNYFRVIDVCPDSFNITMVKRCFGLPGDSVRIDFKGLSISNDGLKTVSENYQSNDFFL